MLQLLGKGVKILDKKLEAARYELDELVRKLMYLEPSWKKCSCCLNKGKCCIGANILIFSVEWKQIVDFVANLPLAEKQIIKSNIKNSKQCIFRSEQKCLIHSVRPLNCRWTPYQVFSDSKNMTYFEDFECNFTQKSVPYSFNEIYPNYVLLPNAESSQGKYYLLLTNWIKKWLPLGDAECLSELFTEPEFLNLLDYN